MKALQETIQRVYVEKREGFSREAGDLLQDLTGFLGSRYPDLASLQGIRILQRYDVAGLSEAQWRQAVALVLSEAPCDRVFYGPLIPAAAKDRYFGIEYLPGQYDQRADSAEQCIELVTGVKPRVKTARFYLFHSSAPLSDASLEGVKQYLINPVDSREASPYALFEEAQAAVQDIPVLTGFSRTGDLAALQARYGLAMSEADLRCCQSYFSSCSREPSLAELRLLDTYWSDHCRHSTFTTALHILNGDETSLDPGLKQALARYEAARRYVYAHGEAPPKTLMDIATIGAKVLKKQGLLEDVDVSEEINACTVKVPVEFRDAGISRQEPWLLLFKNETHNHPTEIEPFGGAATCLGGAIRDPLSGRAYVHQAMRICGGGDPRARLSETLPGKLPQIKLAREAAQGFASYGNQIGLATGQVSEWYHPGFLAKRMELGAVMGAVPAAWVRREEPKKGDLVLLVGGKTGRDGIGGATGSSKAHHGASVAGSAAEVQKGNALEERKLQRLFRNPQVSSLIKRCNDFGAGGLAVAVGELASGLRVDLDSIPKKYTGLDGVELALSESQERMAVVLSPDAAERFIRYAREENLEATVIAEVLAGGQDAAALGPGEAGPRLCMHWRGTCIVDLSRHFLNSGGAPRFAQVLLPTGASSRSAPQAPHFSPEQVLERLQQELGSLRSGSRRGLQEGFDGSVGAASVLFPWGGKEQGTPECGMASLISTTDRCSATASLMSYGYNPELSGQNPYRGAKGAIKEALAKFACLGGNPWTSRLSLQEYFERPERPASWGKPAAALLGALEAQLALQVPAIGGKDSMSGTYHDEEQGISLCVPPSLVAFAAGTAPAGSICSGALSGAPGNPIVLLYEEPQKDEWECFKANMETLMALHRAGLVRAAYPVGPGGIAASLALMAFGNRAGLEAEAQACSLLDQSSYQGAVLVELDAGACSPDALARSLAGAGAWALAAKTIGEPLFRIRLASEAAGAGGRNEGTYAVPPQSATPSTPTAGVHTAGAPADAGGRNEGTYAVPPQSATPSTPTAGVHTAGAPADAGGRNEGTYAVPPQSATPSTPTAGAPAGAGSRNEGTYALLPQSATPSTPTAGAPAGAGSRNEGTYAVLPQSAPPPLPTAGVPAGAGGRNEGTYAVPPQSAPPPLPTAGVPAGAGGRNEGTYAVPPQSAAPSTPTAGAPADAGGRNEGTYAVLPQSATPSTPTAGAPAGAGGRNEGTYAVLPQSAAPPLHTADAPAGAGSRNEGTYAVLPQSATPSLPTAGVPAGAGGRNEGTYAVPPQSAAPSTPTAGAPAGAGSRNEGTYAVPPQSAAPSTPAAGAPAGAGSRNEGTYAVPPQSATPPMPTAGVPAGAGGRNEGTYAVPPQSATPPMPTAGVPAGAGGRNEGTYAVLTQSAPPPLHTADAPTAGAPAGAGGRNEGTYAVLTQSAPPPLHTADAPTAGEPAGAGGRNEGTYAVPPQSAAPSMPAAGAPTAGVSLALLRQAYEGPLNRVYPQTSQGRTVAEQDPGKEETFAFEPQDWRNKGSPAAPKPRPPFSLLNRQGPLVILPVFPGTNGEWDMARAFRRAGGSTRLLVFRNQNRQQIQASIKELASALGEARILALSGGFSAGDEPEGSGKFIANVFRAPRIREGLHGLLEARDGLILGICNGFQALIKLGLVPYGTYREADPAMPTLTCNRIGRHVSRMVRTKVMSNLSPWLAQEAPGTIQVIPVSHGEGRLVIDKAQGEALFKAGQVPFCYVNEEGLPTAAEPDNPNGSDFAIEGLTSPDGRILGKMGHSERAGAYVHRNIPGNKYQGIFEAGVGYFS